MKRAIICNAEGSILENETNTQVSTSQAFFDEMPNVGLVEDNRL